jgi:outer membrane receptor protein involved in Fe transport
VTFAKDPLAAAPGWRAQAWTQVSDLFNTSVSVNATRSMTTLTNDQYATPAIGYGANLAARFQPTDGSLEIGLDVRGAQGRDEETYDGVAGALTYDRHAGGQTLTGGAYADATRRWGSWLLVAGARLDGWAVFDSERLERDLVTGAVTQDLRPAARGGALPSGRLALRYDVDGALYLRGAAYTGFRAPTLNELYRPFRVGNNVTEANSDLTPERLYGAEGGAGGAWGPLGWDATAFYDQLANPVLNVTLRDGPFTDPVAGYIPAGGALLQRENSGAINAYGLEADARARLTPILSTRAALDWTYSTVAGGAAAPQLTGLRPAETPRLAATWGLDFQALPRLTLGAALRYESARYDDDQNLHRLGPAAAANLRADWRVSRSATLFVAVDNLFNVAVATGQTANYVTSYGPPRRVLAGVKLSSLQ